MAEGRILKKRISESKRLGQLQSDSTRLLYTWLIPWLDVEGRYSADPDILKGHLFPKVKSITPLKIKKLLNELGEIGLIILYRFNGESYLQFTTFHEIQKIHRDREAESKIPSPDDNSCELMQPYDLSCLSKSNISEIKENIYSSHFLEFWKEYPKKQGKEAAALKWKTLSDLQKKEVVEAAKNYNRHVEILKTENAFIKNAEGFLNKAKKYWADFLPDVWIPPRQSGEYRASQIGSSTSSPPWKDHGMTHEQWDTAMVMYHKQKKDTPGLMVPEFIKTWKEGRSNQ